MEGMLSSGDQQRLVSSFLEIAVGQTAETARQFLQVCCSKLVDLFCSKLCFFFKTQLIDLSE